MDRVLRLAGTLIVVLAAARAACFFIYALLSLPSPVEVSSLEGKMALLAWRAQAGLSLYPEWRDYPHVANFFSPCYFLLVGWLGRATGAGLDDLMWIGRAVSVGGGLLAAAAIGLDLGRRLGWGSGAVGALASFGAMPMLSVGGMVRPDMLADALGLCGFLLARTPAARARLGGGGLLVLAILTKQTAAVYLLAAVLAVTLEGRRAAAARLLAGVAAAVGAVVAGVTLAVEPQFARSLVGEAGAPPDFAAWRALMGHLATAAPDLWVFTGLGLALWLRGRTREPALATLAVVVLVVAVAAAVKKGSESNYFLGVRSVEALAIGTFWRAIRGPIAGRRGAWAAAAVVGALALARSTVVASVVVPLTLETRRVLATEAGRAKMAEYRSVLRMAERPDVPLLTDLSMVEYHRGAHADFGDPFLFRMLVETGRIRPTAMREAIRAGKYKAIITSRDIAQPAYRTDTLGLPMVLVEEALRHYRPAADVAGLKVYIPIRAAVPEEAAPPR